MNEHQFRLALGRAIRDRRRHAEMSQAEVAAELNESPNTISRWETGVYHPSAFDYLRLEQCFGIRPLIHVKEELKRAARTTKRTSPDRADLNTTIKRLRKDRSERAAKGRK